MLTPEFWMNKRVYMTGHTGFKGSWLSIWLKELGANVKGYALNPPTQPSLYKEANVDELVESEIGDICNYEQLNISMSEFNPDILIHMAAQPLVRHSYREPIETYDTNVLGTVKVLEAARHCQNLKAIICITTDKCYENREWAWGYRENEPMGGFDPYSSSKGCAELVISAYRRSFIQEKNIGLASVRAGNVIGGGDWAEDRLIPDILRAFENGDTVFIRNPGSIRPWQHVLEPLSGYLLLAEKLYVSPCDYAEGWNFGPKDSDARHVEWILESIISSWPGSSWTLDQAETPHEARYLKLDISKAADRLQWKPIWQLKDALNRIVGWHKAWLNKENMQNFCKEEIKDYMRDMQHERS